MQNRICLIAALAVLFSLSAEAVQPTKLVEDARHQIGVTLGYDGKYYRIDYPMGDVPLSSGVCSDVVIRAYRGQQTDLQQLVHQDMKSAWASYPKLWGLKTTDRNIDHRRVPNLEAFFKRHGQSLSLTEIATFKPGDIVTWRLPGNLPHIGIVSDKQSEDGTPLIIHNIGRGAQEENMLFNYKIVGHYRY